MIEICGCGADVVVELEGKPGGLKLAADMLLRWRAASLQREMIVTNRLPLDRIGDCGVVVPGA